MKPIRLCVAAALLFFTGNAALACACCTNPAQRLVEVQQIETRHSAELDRLRFRKEATLHIVEGYEEGIKGLEEPEANFTLNVTRQKDRYVFALMDGKGRGGNLALVLPKQISLFEVDTRDDTEKTGFGPRLYKEWKLTGNVTGDGIFKNSVGQNRRITLVLHGRGSSCTEASDFRHWTLLVHAPKTETYTFFGEFESQN